MKKIGIVYKTEDRIIEGTAKKLEEELADNYRVVLDEKKFKDLDLVITLGGDGTILRASKITSGYDIPILPIHLGGLGIMSEIYLDGLMEALHNFNAKKFRIDRRMMLEVEIQKRGAKKISGRALNDVVIGKNEIARTIKLNAYQKERLIADYVGDGLVISTPTGSTAYNFAVMGPILPVDSKSYILSPICPHRAANRSIVMHDPVMVRLAKGKNILLTIDGQAKVSLREGDRVYIHRSKKTTSFIRFKEYDLWELLRKRMGWE